MVNMERIAALCQRQYFMDKENAIQDVYKSQAFMFKDECVLWDNLPIPMCSAKMRG